MLGASFPFWEQCLGQGEEPSQMASEMHEGTGATTDFILNGLRSHGGFIWGVSQFLKHHFGFRKVENLQVWKQETCQKTITYIGVLNEIFSKTLWKLDIIIYYYFMCTFKKCVQLGTQKSLSGKEPRVWPSSVYRRGNWSSLGKFLDGVTGWNLAEICTGRAAHFFTAELTAQHAVSHRSVIITRKGNAEGDSTLKFHLSWKAFV